MKTETKVIFYSVIAAILVWVLDALIDYFFFYTGTTLGGIMVTHVPSYEIYMRTLIGGSFIIFGIILARYFGSYKNSVRELFHREMSYSTTLQSIGDAVIATDASGIINFMNPVAERLTGWSIDDAYGQQINDIFKIVNEYSDEKVENPIDKVLRDGLVVGLANHTVLIARDGKRYPIDDSGAPIKDKTGKVIGTVLVFHDVSERREAERKIHDSEEQKRLVLENMISGYAIHEMLYDDNGRACDYKFLGVNEAFINLVGIPDPTGKTLREALPNVEQKWIDIYEEIVSTGKHREFEEFSPSAGVWWHVIAFKVKSKQFATIFMDVSSRRQAELKIKESEQEKRLVLENMLAAYALQEVVYDDSGAVKDCRFLQVNKSFVRMVGIPDPSGHTVSEVLPGANRKWIGMFADVVRTGAAIEIEDYAEERNTWWHVTAFKVQENQFATIFTDITEPKLKSEQIRKSKEFNEKLISTANVMIVCLNDMGKITIFNDTAEVISGYSREELKRQNWFETLVPRDKYPQVWDIFEKTIKTTSEPPEIFESPILTKNGEERIISWRNSCIRDENGGNCILSFGIDITEMKHAEEALATEREKLAVTLGSIGDGVIASDTQGRVVVLNKVAETLTGWKESDAIGRSLTEIFNIINEKTRLRCENPVEKVLKLGCVVGLANHTVLISRDGKEQAIADSGAPIRNNQGDIIGVVLVFRDVTETLRLQEFAARAQRLETAGRIAVQVAHDFNNLLGPLTAYPGLIKDDLPEDHPAHELLDQIQNSAQQMADINQQLLTLGRRGHYNLEPINLNEIINQVLMQFYPIARTTAIELDLSPDLFNMSGGKAQIFRVLTNLITNAMDAINEVGKINIKTENYYVDSIEGKYGRVPQGEYVKFTLTDNGNGIAPTDVSKIFDPFYTTKTAEGRRGSGLGLSIVHAVVEDHNGHLDFSTKLGKGTSFYLYFPITRESSKGEDINENMLGGSEKILIIDDDLTQREVTRILLEKLGYEVKTSQSGEDALQLLQTESYDLLLLDMIMPGGIDGTETYERALDIHPDQKALIVSGFAENKRVKEALDLGAGGFLRKPLTIKSIALAVRKELDRVVRNHHLDVDD